ncbi:MAG TPA: hypothetical protein VG329_11600 [Candidatus Dormibacteraeota bacterium]|jgi:hypothetical protein|nr:hypothetical protein [Candidatus Dormibacteraeota bacterium]
MSGPTIAKAEKSGTALVLARVKDGDRWDLADTKETRMQTRQGYRLGWILTFRRRPDPGEEKDWRTTIGITVFVDGSTGVAELLR